jgi:hypothetical protein
MEATPFEQVVVLALATKLTGEPTVEPLLGLLTLTPARALGVKLTIRETYTERLLMYCTLQIG